MRSTLIFPCAFVTLIAAAGCASIIGIPQASIEWCQQPANNTHDFCEDFDHSDPFGAWPASPPPPPGTTRGLAPGESPPFALDTVVGPLEAGASAYTGLETSFPSQTFNDVKLGVDIRIAQINFTIGEVITGAGFLLLADSSTAADEPSLCVGLGLAPATVSGTVDLALFLVPNSSNCVTVNNLSADAGADAATPSTGDDAEAGSESALPAYPQPYPVGGVYLETWTHIALEVQRNQENGSGVITFAATPNQGGGGMLPTIPPQSLGAGVPELGIATDVTGPSSGAFEVLFDNITVDFGG
ncbi:MAG TPA: hypothetical protein VEK07_23685 [Polyangiaceae bacterium]|nr:hypothetical protein [Polyangiaceae bacterium]